MTDQRAIRMAAAILHKYGQHMTNKERDELYDSVGGDLRSLASEIYKIGAPFNYREAEVLSRVAGNLEDDKHSLDFNKYGDLWEDDILDKYAAHVLNYEYQYNDEAKKVDPNTDTEQVHIGPMAQDLEKVNPAVVKEDPKSGYKTVDTGRLALMNAGAIADLARIVKNDSNNKS